MKFTMVINWTTMRTMLVVVGPTHYGSLGAYIHAHITYGYTGVPCMGKYLYMPIATRSL